jgi:hypothetical protein
MAGRTQFRTCRIRPSARWTPSCPPPRTYRSKHRGPLNPAFGLSARNNGFNSPDAPRAMAISSSVSIHWTFEIEMGRGRTESSGRDDHWRERKALQDRELRATPVRIAIQPSSSPVPKALTGQLSQRYCRIWRRGELNPCPRSFLRKLLHAYPMVSFKGPNVAPAHCRPPSVHEIPSPPVAVTPPND